MLVPAPAYNLQLSDEGIEPCDRCRPILTHCLVPCGLGPPFWGVRGSWDGLSTWGVEGQPCPYRVSLSDVRVVIAIMCAFVVKLMCQAAMRRIPALKCLPPGACGCLWLCPILSGIKWPLFPRIPALELATQYWQPLGVTTGS
jgi:hypothetical protein